MLIHLGVLLLGLFCLYWGAESLVKGASSIALRLGVSPLIIGLTIVAFGTSMPELVVSLKGNAMQQGGIAIGNVVGSNIFNIAVIIGIAALIYPMQVRIQLIRLDSPIMIIISLIFFLMFSDFQISRIEGLFLFIGLIIYTGGTYIAAFRESRQEQKITAEMNIALPRKTGSYWWDALLIGIGLMLLILGSRFFVNGAIALAQLLGVSAAIIGLTIVAAGTSLPELATSAVAAFKKQPEIAIGNIVGSNIFNILGIIGLTALISPINGIGIHASDFYWMLGTAMILLPIMWSGLIINRLEGLLLLCSYVVYMFLLWKK